MPRRLQFGLRDLLVWVAICAPVFALFASLSVEARLLYAWLWFVHAAIAVVLSAPVVFLARRRVRWVLYDLLALIAPFIVWAVLMAHGPAGKSLANFGEAFYLGLVVPLALLLRASFGRREPVQRYSLLMTSLLCLAAVAIFFLTPSLPE
ncbi:MAG: hypothetical protein WD278_13705 [Pirellulales bacterium]